MLGKHLKLLVIIGCVAATLPNAYAARDTSFSNESSSTSLWNFRVAPMVAMQTNTNNVSRDNYSTYLSWNPQMNLSDSFYVALDLGAARFKNMLYQKFWIFEYQAVLGYWMSQSFGLEATGGAQTWTKKGKTNFMAGGNFQFRFTPLFGFIDRAFVGYSGLFATAYYTSQIRLGVGLSF